MVSIKTGLCTLTLTLRNFKIEHQYDIYLYLETSLYVKVRLLYRNSLDFWLTGPDLMFRVLRVFYICLSGHFRAQVVAKVLARDR